jgi:hypothetical protein
MSRVKPTTSRPLSIRAWTRGSQNAIPVIIQLEVRNKPVPAGTEIAPSLYGNDDFAPKINQADRA